MILRRHPLALAFALAMVALNAATPTRAVAGEAGSSPQSSTASVTTRDAAKIASDAATATVDQFHAALKAGDGKAALALLSPALVVYESGHVERSRDEYEAQHLQADMRFVAKATTTLLARSSSIEGSVAQVLSESAVSTEREGKPVRQHSLETMLLRKTAEGWRITHIHWSSRTLREADAEK